MSKEEKVTAFDQETDYESGMHPSEGKTARGQTEQKGSTIAGLPSTLREEEAVASAAARTDSRPASLPGAAAMRGYRQVSTDSVLSAATLSPATACGIEPVSLNTVSMEDPSTSLALDPNTRTIEATLVPPIQKAEVDESHKIWRQRFLFLLSLCVVVTLAVGVGVGLPGKLSDNSPDPLTPTLAPTVSPYAAFGSRNELQIAVQNYLESDGQDTDVLELYGPIGRWNVSAIQDFSYLFSNKDGREVSFNEEIGEWDVSNAISFKSMFYSQFAFNADISGWSTSKVEDMSSMFHRANAFNIDISNWDVSRVQTAAEMFRAANEFNQPLNSWRTSKLVNISNMFESADKFDMPLDDWDTSNVIDMSDMFSFAFSFNHSLDMWNVSGLRDASSMFNAAVSFSQSLCSWGTQLSPSTNVFLMFESSGCSITADPNFVSSPPGPFCQVCVTPPYFDRTLLGALQDQGNYSLFLHMLEVSRLSSLLADEYSRFTIFAPPDEALMEEKQVWWRVSRYLNDTDTWWRQIRCTVENHMGTEVVLEADFSSERVVETIDIDMEPIGFVSLEPPTISLRNGWTNPVITKTDIMAKNGVIHQINQILAPLCLTFSTWQVLQTLEEFSMWYELVQISGILEDDRVISRSNLSLDFPPFNSNPLTVFPTSNPDFEKSLGSCGFAALKQDTTLIRSIVLYSVSPIVFLSEDYPVGTTVEIPSLLDDAFLNLTKFQDGGFQINDLPVINPNELTQSGALHVLEGLLVPEGVKLPTCGETDSNDTVLTSSPVPVSSAPEQRQFYFFSLFCSLACSLHLLFPQI